MDPADPRGRPPWLLMLLGLLLTGAALVLAVPALFLLWGLVLAVGSLTGLGPEMRHGADAGLLLLAPPVILVDGLIFRAASRLIRAGRAARADAREAAKPPSSLL